MHFVDLQKQDYTAKSEREMNVYSNRFNFIFLRSVFLTFLTFFCSSLYICHTVFLIVFIEVL